MTTGEIRAGQIWASSNYPPEWDRGCSEKYARVYQPGDQAWCAKYKSASEWLQVDLGVPAKVSRVIMGQNNLQRRRSAKPEVVFHTILDSVGPREFT